MLQCDTVTAVWPHSPLTDCVSGWLRVAQPVTSSGEMGLAGLATLHGDQRTVFDPRNFRFTAANNKCDSGGETVETSDEEEEEEDEDNIENNNVEDHLGWEEEQQSEDLLGGEKLSLRNLKWIATLGVGGFGRVELVTAGHNNNLAFALKKMKKNEV